MKLKDLEGKSREEQSRLIEDQPIVFLLDMLKNPKRMQGKIVVFRGNYDEFDTDGLCVRVFEYGEKENQWKVWDIDLSDMFTSVFDHTFTGDELKMRFEAFCSRYGGFLLEK